MEIVQLFFDRLNPGFCKGMGNPYSATVKANNGWWADTLSLLMPPISLVSCTSIFCSTSTLLFLTYSNCSYRNEIPLTPKSITSPLHSLSLIIS